MFYGHFLASFSNVQNISITTFSEYSPNNIIKILKSSNFCKMFLFYYYCNTFITIINDIQKGLKKSIYN